MQFSYAVIGISVAPAEHTELDLYHRKSDATGESRDTQDSAR